MSGRICHFVLVLTVLVGAPSPAAAQPTTPTKQDAKDSPEVVECRSLLREFERLLRAKDGAAFRKFVLVTKDPDAEEKLNELADAIQSGALAQARIVPLEAKSDGGVVCVIAAFLVRPADADRPEVEPSLFVRRDGKWRLIHGSPHAAKTIMTEPEAAATDRHKKWVDAWREANEDAIVERVKAAK